jgi:hypothetical protein
MGIRTKAKQAAKVKVKTKTPAVKPAAKAKAGPKAKAEPKTRIVLNIKGSEAWRAWVHRLAAFQHIRAPMLIERTLIAEARRCGFKPRPPKR